MYRISLTSGVEARDRIKKYDAVAAFILPVGLESSHKQGKRTEISVIRVAETGEFLSALNTLRSAVNKVDANYIIADMVIRDIKKDKDITGKQLLIFNRAYNNARDNWFPAPPVSLELVEKTGEKIATYNQMSHASIGFALFFSMFTVVYGVGEVLEEKRQGTWQRLLTLPVKKWQILAGNLTGSFVMGFIQIVLLILSGQYLFRVNWGSNPLAVLLISAPFILCVTCLGLALSGVVKTEKQLHALTPIVITSTSMLGGLFWPLEVVNSKIMLIISKFIIPQTWTMKTMEDIAVRGRGLDSVFYPLSVLLLMSFVFFIFGLRAIGSE